LDGNLQGLKKTNTVMTLKKDKEEIIYHDFDKSQYFHISVFNICYDICI
jgi:hypothetical protein